MYVCCNACAERAVAVHRIVSRWPGETTTAEAVHTMLSAAGDAMVDVPLGRWPLDPSSGVSRYGGFVSSMQRFDAQSFAISVSEAVQMDPQQRLLLEVSLEAWMSAGERRETIRGASVGVVVAIEHLDWQLMQVQLTSQTVLQRSSTYAATRIEYCHILTARRLVYQCLSPYRHERFLYLV